MMGVDKYKQQIHDLLHVNASLQEQLDISLKKLKSLPKS